MPEEKLLEDYNVFGEYGVKQALHNRFMRYKGIIDTCIETKIPIPPITAKLCFTLFQNIWHVKRKRAKRENDALFKNISKKTIKYFESENGKGYHFSGQKFRQSVAFDPCLMAFETSSNEESYSLNEMIKSCVYAYVHLIRECNFSKDELLKFIYDDIAEYCDRNLTEQQKGKFKPYNMRVVAAYITMCVTDNYFDRKTRIRNKDGVPVIIDLSTDFRNKDLFQSTRIALDPKKASKSKDMSSF